MSCIKTLEFFDKFYLEKINFLGIINLKIIHKRHFFLLIFVPFLVTFFVHKSYGASSIVSHKADYTLSMGKKNRDAAVQDVKGKISFVLKAQCDGWSLKEDYLFQFFYETGEEVTIVSQSDSWEHKNGRLYSFDVREQNSYEPETIYSGYAVLPPQSEIAEANYTGAYNNNLKLFNDIMFPVNYTRTILEAARQEKKFLSGKIFVNGTPEDAIKTAAAAIGRKKPYESDFQFDGVTTAYYWPVNVAYFRENATEAMPEYQIQMELHDNGVVTNFLINYGEFTINAAISNARLIEKVDCM